MNMRLLTPIHRAPARLRRPGASWFALTLCAAIVTACAPLQPSQSDEDRLRAQLAEEARQAARPSAQCSAQPGTPFAFRKKVLVLALPVHRPLEAADLPGLSGAWSAALQQRLQSTDRFVLRDGSAYALDPAGDARQQVMALAQQFDAQVVIAGRIDSVGIRKGRIELGPLHPIPQPFGDVRVIETTLQVFDGYTGTPIKQLSHTGEVRGVVENRSPSTLRGGFFQTTLGETVATMLDRQRDDIEDELACLPMQARIVHSRQHEIHIDAGFTSNLKPGDRLRVVQRNSGNSMTSGSSERSYGDLVISQVFAQTAVGHFDGGVRPNWEFNGYVRAW